VNLHISTKKTFILAIGFLVGLAIPFIVLYLTDLINTKIQNKDDIKKKTKVPIIAEIGHNDKNENELITKDSRSAIAENFRSLRTNLAFYLKSKDQKAILLSSSISGEGKSFVAINLALV